MPMPMNTEKARGPKPRVAPPRALPLLHAGMAAVAIAVLYVPMVRLRDGSVLRIIDITVLWAQASLLLLALLIAAALFLTASNRVTWSRLLLVDLSVIVALIPAVIGLVVDWNTPAGGVDGIAWGFWLAVALLALRMPLTLWIRGQAARLQTPRKPT